MHDSSSMFNVPVDVSVRAHGIASRDGRVAPRQRFVRIESGGLEPGDTVLNPGSMTVHRIVSVGDDSVMLTIRNGRHVVRWDDLIEACWKVVES
jgi:hypothetical protein